MPLRGWNFPESAAAEPFGTGLINQTFAVRNQGQTLAFLQRLNTEIFVPEVHEDIEAVTAWIESRGLATPRLIRTRTGALWHIGPKGGVWRCLTPIGDRSVDKLADPADARSAGALVARFHAALKGFRWDFRSVRPGAHDTARHIDGMTAAVGEHRKHRLWWDVASASETIYEGWNSWNGPTDLPRRVIHGDLKISNVQFRGSEALALIDLDTLQWGTLDVELGDAMRSWCNPASEDSSHTAFDLGIFEAAMEGYAAGSKAHPPTAQEWAGIVPGIERICWELSARFARDALEERYFGWNEAHGGRGEHNLLRARGQLALARSVRAQRAEAERVIARVRS